MKLSDAIRLGAMVSPQGFNGWMDGEARCALAAAQDAVGIPPLFEEHAQRVGIDYIALRQRWPMLCESGTRASGFRGDLLCRIVVLNDDCHWSRERIADWVETIEQARDATQTQVLQER